MSRKVKKLHQKFPNQISFDYLRIKCHRMMLQRDGATTRYQSRDYQENVRVKS